ncbi:MAG: DUF6286 domain-containing protein [Cellulomonas sp.]
MTTVEQPAHPAPSGAKARPAPPAAAKAPLGPGGITAVGILLALGLIGLGVVALHDALIPSALVGGPAWIGSTLRALDGVEPASWMVPAGLVLVIVGVWALVIALRPRPRTGITLTARTGVYLRARDVARIAATASDDVDGVVAVKASATRRTVTVTVSVRGDETEQVAAAVRGAVSEALRALMVAPQIRVRVTSVAGPR